MTISKTSENIYNFKIDFSLRLKDSFQIIFFLEIFHAPNIIENSQYSYF